MKPRHFHGAAAAAAIVAAVVVLRVWSPVLFGGQGQPPLFRASADRVRIDALVIRDRLPALGLTADDFEVFDNGVRQRVELSTTARSVSAALLLDVSGSVRGDALTRLADATRAFSDALQPGDVASLVSFSRRLTLDAPSVHDPAVIRQAILGAEAVGRTAMWDAIVAGASLLQDAGSPPLLVVFTDGADTYSYLDEKKALACLDRSNVVVHVVYAGHVPPPGFFPEGANITIIDRTGDAMRNLARRTGGSVWPAETDGDLPGQFVRVLREFRSRYLLAYEPAGVRRDDGWHEVKVRVKDRHADVRARPGYFAGGR